MRDNQSSKLCNTTFLEQYRGLLEEAMRTEMINPTLLTELLIRQDLAFKDTETDLCTEEWKSLENLDSLYKDVHLLGSTSPIFQ